ncbi:hypothetical protein MS2017_1186 [Bathymodiolus thermophilus thioautotrophic gill symbiont]|uniref:Uncharacterized protein n=1 Tax=Bathymodiolus thermophilus thioautotrophic gill symbiont TaxID=2360 RepID=A0A3G3IM08_9GAMM|nr:hypothetical protein MS2017_1186 [Bathymodiolus thermophilus thioautotrophic gill symbiont]
MDELVKFNLCPIGVFLNLVLAELKLGLKNYQVGKMGILDDYSYLYKGLIGKLGKVDC